MGNLTKRPNVPKTAEEFISGAPDATRGAPSVPASAPAPAANRSATGDFLKSGNKRQISLTIEPNMLADLDQAAANLGISRASAFSLAVARFIAQEKKGA
jgi:hypothetical protein